MVTSLSDQCESQYTEEACKNSIKMPTGTSVESGCINGVCKGNEWMVIMHRVKQRRKHVNSSFPSSDLCKSLHNC